MVNESEIHEANSPAAAAHAFWDLVRNCGLTAGADMLALASVMLLLRWADHEEREVAAVAEFNGEDIETLQTGMDWQEFASRTGWRRQSMYDAMIHKLRRHNRDMSALAGIVRKLDQLPNGVGDSIVDWTSQFPVERRQDRQYIGKVLDHMASTLHRDLRGFGEYATESLVADLMVSLADPKPGERIYDPCFGFGNLLVCGARKIMDASRYAPPSQWNDLRYETIFGVELNTESYFIGLARIVFSGIDYPGLVLGNALERDVGATDAASQFDCILCDPPIGGKIAAPTASHYPLLTNDSVSLFIQHAITSLRPGGRAIIHVPSGVLFRSGADERLRELLATNYCLEGVIALPPGMHRAYSSIQTNLLIIRNSQPKKVVRFLQVDPTMRDGKSRSEKKDIPFVPTAIAKKFWHGELNSVLWETSFQELAKRGWDLQARRIGHDKYEGFLKAVAAADPDVPQIALAEVAELITGVNYSRADTVTDASDNTVGLLRVTDVTSKVVKVPGLYVLPEKIPNYGAKVLRAGDVLVSSGGTIGKVGVVGTNLTDSVPSKSLISIRCSERLRPEYLLAILRSDAYREWMNGHATGSVIMHLTGRSLARLIVPVPPLPVQMRVAESANSGRDATKELLRILEGDNIDPLSDWLGSPNMVALRSSLASSIEVNPEQLLEQTAKNVAEARNSIAHSLDDRIPDSAQVLLIGLDAGMNQLVGLSKLPAGPVRYAALERALMAAQQLENMLSNAIVSWERELYQVAQAIRSVTWSVMEPMLWMKPPVFSTNPAMVSAGVASDISLVITNSNALPLRSLTIRTEPDIGGREAEFLDAKSTIRIPLVLAGSVGEGRFDFSVSWSAKKLDGEEINGEAQLTVGVQSGRDAHYEVALGESPYNGQDAVDRPEMFKGREQLVRRMHAELAKPQPAKVILLEGNRRMGKTSILNRITQEPPLGWLPVYCSFQGGAGFGSRAGLSDQEIFRLMARQIGWSVWDAQKIKTWCGSPSADADTNFKKLFSETTLSAFQTDHPVEVFELYLQSVLAAIKPMRLLLLLDEFDKIQEGIAAGTTNPIVPENLRSLLKAYTGFAVVLAGSKRLKRLREDYWSALFGLGERMEVGPLDERPAEELVVEPVRSRLVFAPDAVEKIVSLCGRRPNLIQVLCNNLFYEAKESGNRSITASIVESIAIEKMTGENEHFATLWQYAGTERKRLILSLCAHLARQGIPVTFSIIEEEIQSAGIFIPRAEKLEDDITDLLEQEVLVRSSTPLITTYAVSVPLLESWIMNNYGDLQMLVRRALRDAEEKHE